VCARARPYVCVKVSGGGSCGTDLRAGVCVHVFVCVLVSPLSVFACGCIRVCGSEGEQIGERFTRVCVCVRVCVCACACVCTLLNPFSVCGA